MPCQGGPQLPPRATRRLQSPPPFHAEPATAIVIGGGGIWSCTRLRAIAAEASIGAAADRGHCSFTNMLEVLIRKYCAWNGTGIPELTPLFSGDRTSSYSRQA